MRVIELNEQLHVAQLGHESREERHGALIRVLRVELRVVSAESRGREEDDVLEEYSITLEAKCARAHRLVHCPLPAQTRTRCKHPFFALQKCKDAPQHTV